MTRLRFGAGLLLLLAIAAACAPLASGWLGHDPFAPDLFKRHAPASAAHPLGTDALGRDLLLRLLHGARATALGAALAARGWTLVYGGGKVGLMGLLAQACLDAGGAVTGVIPGFLSSREVLHPGLQISHQVEDLFERKALMIELADAFVALPGGIGTFEEFFEVWTWRQLGYHDKPIGLINTRGYYDGLLAFSRHSVEQGFLSDGQMDLIQVGENATDLLRSLVQTAGFTAPAHLENI